MKQYYVLGIVVLVVISLMFYRSYFLNQDYSVDQTSKQNAVVTITVSDEGFSPDTVTVSEGTKVVFVNEGKNSHWPASDFHPTHGIYPEFDPLKGINPGEEWSFVLKPGKWHFHDHLYPSFIGTIEVTK